ncbi:unnamed protein product [Plasmodium vivax]|uniref:(malaria parasite P. vivax) hypothetical protein n=1 Tax=Plasmodium vivax TaxID=5855 RepID=A0A8S4H2T0_PLAVI|nr:unnamed protein product [Plasmodium vivax]
MAISPEDDEYDFADIFPTCKYEFDSETKNLDTEYDCYNTMISAYSKDSDGIDVCKENIEEINEKTLEKFQKLNSLYDIYYEFMNAKEEDGSTKCDLGKTCSFTPVYSWLHSILRKKSNIRNDLYEESRDLKNNANMKKFNSKNSPLNIQYYSSENT